MIKKFSCCCLGILSLSVLAITLRKTTFVLIFIIKYLEKLGTSKRTGKKDAYTYLVNK